MFKSFENLVKNRQSCRDFNGNPLGKDTVERIAKLAMLAPSACNSQPWKMYLVNERERVQAVAEATQDGGHNKFTSGAQAFIVISEKDATLKDSVAANFSRNHFVKYDIGELLAYITLGAESLGVSTCIIGWLNQEKIKKAISLPDGEAVNVIVALGYSDIPLREKKRKPEEEVIVVL